MVTFRKVSLDVSRGKGYGQYKVSAYYYGRHIIVHTTDSEIYDWLNDDSNKAKHNDAKRAAYMLIRNAHEQVTK